MRRGFMGRFDLPDQLSKLVVDGILKGYKEYLSVRRRAQQELKVSAAYAWVKGNHIDSSVDETCSKYDAIESSIESTVEKAGYTWEYIQFILKDSQEKYLVIVKNGRGIAKTFNGRTKKVNQENYLYEYAGINNPLVEEKSLKTKDSDRVIQLELSLTEIEAIQTKVSLQAPEGYNRFYVVTYEFAPDSKMISKIALTLPNQQEMILVEVADLTPLIEKSEFSISEDELEIVKSDKVPESIYADGDQLFGYGVAAEEHEDLEKKANQ